MFLLKQAALLVFVPRCGGFAGAHPVVNKNKQVYRGDSVSLKCNSSEADILQIQWTKDRFILSYSAKENRTVSDFSDRLRLDDNSPIKLIISNAQDEDEGLYNCTVTGSNTGSVRTQWNLTVSEKPKGETSFRYLPHVVTPVTGGFLCCIIAAVCFCRKRRPKTPNPNPNPIHSSNMQISQEQSNTDRRMNNNRRSQYMERLNSIYNAY